LWEGALLRWKHVIGIRLVGRGSEIWLTVKFTLREELTHVDFSLVGCKAVQSGESPPTFQRNMSPPSSELMTEATRSSRRSNLTELHGLTSQKRQFFITTAVRTSDPSLNRSFSISWFYKIWLGVSEEKNWCPPLRVCSMRYDVGYKYILITLGIFRFSCVEAGSNTSTVALRVVGSDEKGTHCRGAWPGHPVLGVYKYGMLTLHVGGVWNLRQ
jgi:hypothetical protein